jgi:hypothetical protein
MTRYPLVAATLAALALSAAPASAEIPQYCMYPYDGSICTPTLRDVAGRLPRVRVTEFCIYPYDGSICVPWVEVGS